MTRVTQLPEGVSQTDSWPYDRLPTPPLPPEDAPWSLLMDASGAMVLWPAADRVPDALGVLKVWAGDREALERFCAAFCCMGYNTDPVAFPHQDGVHWIFNWVSGTMAQLSVAAQVAAAFTNPDQPDRRARWDAAWAAGHAFDDQLQAALREVNG